MVGRLRSLVAPLFLLIAGCARNVASTAFDDRAIRMEVEDFGREPKSVDASDAREDLEQAVLLFDAAYAGVPRGSRLPSSVDVDAAKARLTTRSAWPPDSFAALLRTLFHRPDGHLAFGGRRLHREKM